MIKRLFDRAVDYFHNGSGNGSLTHYIINEQGQCQESGRDQQHTQLGLAHLAEACEIAWNQGLDLYATADNRLLKGFEYTAKYNLGHDVPFVPYRDTTGKYYAQAHFDAGSRPPATDLRDGLEPLRETQGHPLAVHEAGRREDPAGGRRIRGRPSGLRHAAVYPAEPRAIPG